MKKILITVISIIFSTLCAFAQFYKDYPEDLRKELAEAYYLVAERYLELGFPEGEKYKKQAFEIFPELKPESINREKTHNKSEEALEKSGESGDLEKTSRLITYSFTRFIGALASKDTARLALFIYDTTGNGLRKGEMLERLESLASDFPAPGFSPFELYDFGSMTIEPASAGPETPSDSYALKIRTRDKDERSMLGFYSDEHVFSYRKSGEIYLITSIEGLFDTGIPETGKQESIDKIKQAFGGCIAAFIDKQAEAAAKHLGEEVLILPMRTAITRNEVVVTFTGYFSDEKYDASGLVLKDVVDYESLLIKKTSILNDKYPNGVYKLVPSFKREYSKKIPFFTQYKIFYFANIKNEWLIVAVN